MDTTAWEYYDLSCKSRDDTNDQVLADGCAAGARVKSIFKEPTITPSEAQRVKFGLKNVRTHSQVACVRVLELARLPRAHCVVSFAFVSRSLAAPTV